MSTTDNQTNNISPPRKKHSSFSANTAPLIVLVIVIILLGIIFTFFHSDTTHWMSGPGIAIMVVFMPLTAISFLHFRLPMKQEEFKAIRKTLHTEKDNTETFGMVLRQEQSGADYLLPIFFVSFFSALGFYILFANSAAVLFNGMEWVDAGAKQVTDVSLVKSTEWVSRFDTANFRRSVVAVGMSFLGAYIWSVQYIFRRMMTLDLPPGAYYSIGSRMVYSAFLAVILQHFMSSNSDPVDEVLSNQLIAVSFLVGIFPERALAWMQESLGQIFSRKSTAAKPLPLEMLEGISSFHKARLSELGIDNVQNLAQASLMELILKTPFRPRVLIDWMAQARLCIEFKENISKIRAAGIRTILDLQEIDNEEPLLEALANNSGVDLSIIKTICQVNRNEKAVTRLRHAYDALNMV